MKFARFSFVFLSFALLTALTVPAMAANSKKGLLTKVAFRFQKAKKSFQMNQDFILAEGNNSWTPLVPAKEGVVVLGKVNEPSGEIYKVELMIIDTSVTPVSLNQMSILTRTGEPASISSATDEEKHSVSLTLTPTEYTEKENVQ